MNGSAALGSEVSPGDEFAQDVWWIRWGCIALQHAFASLVAAIYLLVLPGAYYTALYVAVLVLAALTTGDFGSMLYAFLALAIFALGAACAAAACACGLILDLARRLFGWPIWISPILVFVAAFGLGLWRCGADGTGTLWATPLAWWIAQIGVALFGMHWIPLVASSGAARCLQVSANTAYARRLARSRSTI